MDFLAREVTHLLNEYGDEVELEIIKYPDHCHVTATICQDEPPYKDCITTGKHRTSRKKAIHKALKQLYIVAYQ
ncbi:hypothetical protein [Bacillus sp. FJAT-27245]|uniref:hypothetical protein n=1 Tax=Bacillus sp. FJAT-27245 TaxID=1684144 RepID=UPI0006A7BA3A|nr:hypothetical protein [Bacillus sp. FJAT-27245]